LLSCECMSEVAAETLVRCLSCSTARPHYSDAFSFVPEKNRPEAVFSFATGNDQSNTGESTPRILCSFGEVVVYCMWIFFSGKMYGAAPNAASAHSWKPDRISFFLPG